MIAIIRVPLHADSYGLTACLSRLPYLVGDIWATFMRNSNYDWGYPIIDRIALLF